MRGLLCFVREPSFRYRDQWIGLRRAAATCTCENATTVDCVNCQESWIWDDGSPMLYRYQDWRNNVSVDPGNMACGRLNALGWADIACDYDLHYICKKYMGKKKKMIYLISLTKPNGWV